MFTTGFPIKRKDSLASIFHINILPIWSSDVFTVLEQALKVLLCLNMPFLSHPYHVSWSSTMTEDKLTEKYSLRWCSLHAAFSSSLLTKEIKLPYMTDLIHITYEKKNLWLTYQNIKDLQTLATLTTQCI